MNCFRVTTAVWLLLLSVVSITGLHAENITRHWGAMRGTPQTDTVAKGYYKFDKGLTARNHVLIGWHTRRMPVVRSEAMEKIVMKRPTFYAVGDSADIQTDTTFYAVWAIDRDNNGSPDYEALLAKPYLDRAFMDKLLSDLRKKREREERAALNGDPSLRSHPYWDINNDLLAYSDSVYYVGCPYNTDPLHDVYEENLIMTNSIGNYRFGLIGLELIRPHKDLELVFEYGGVLEDTCLIGGKDQKPLKRVPFPADSTTTVDKLIDPYPLMFSKIKKDGVGILKMYFVRAGTDTLADGRDWSRTAMGPSPTNPWITPSIHPWNGHFPKPFWDAQTGPGDTLTIKFRIYNKPVFESEVVSQFLDSTGRLRIKHLSGTPLKYMMRSINGWRWQPADSPLTDMEKEYVADNASICLKQLDKVIGNQSYLKKFYQSPELFGYDSPVAIAYTTEYKTEIRQKKNKDVYNKIMSISSPSTLKANVISELAVWMGFGTPLDQALEFVLPSASDASSPFVMQDSIDIRAMGYPKNMTIYSDSIAKKTWNTVYGKRLADNTYVPDNRCREEYCLHFNKRVISIINRAVIIPEVDGVTVSPDPGIHYIPSMKDFKFSVKYPSTPLKVITDRVINGREEVLVGHLNSSGEYEYVIPRVTQNINLKFAPDNVSTAFVEKTAVWSYGREIRIRANKEDVASIYSVAGKLVKRIVIPQGNTTVIPMERGVYMVALKDGSMHKVIVK